MVDRMKPSRLRLLIADPSEHVRAYLASVITIDADQIVQARCATPVELLAAAFSDDLDVALVGLGSDGWLDAITAITATNPNLPVIVLGTTGSNEEIRAAMLAGGRAFLTKPASSDELREAIKAVAARRRPATVAPAAPPYEMGRLVAVVSPRGGSGCSTIAFNLAVTAARNGIDTVVVDANRGFGDIATLAGVRVKQTLLDAAKAPHRVDEFLTTGPLGIGILAAPVGPMDAAKVSTEELRMVLERLRERHDLVLVDAPGAVDDAHLMIVELADVLLVTVIADISALKNTHSYLALLEAAGLSRERRVVLNRHGEVSDVRSGDFRAAFGQIDHYIPADSIRMARAANRGVPVVVSDPESALAGAFTEIAAVIAGLAEDGTSAVATEPATRFGWLHRAKLAALYGSSDTMPAHAGSRDRSQPVLAAGPT
jgi:pilus assembly protein CpaE